MNQPDAVPPDVASKLPGFRQSRERNEGVHRKVDNRHTAGGEFRVADSLRAKASNVRAKSRTIQRLRDLGHLALAAPEIQLAGQQQHRPSHAIAYRFSLSRRACKNVVNIFPNSTFSQTRTSPLC